MRGEFIRGDGLVIPNNIMTYGVNQLFMWALLDSGYALHMGLANCNPTPDLNLSALGEPTIGVNGYARQPIARTTGWPVNGTLNGETYFETASHVFAAVGGEFSEASTRIALINSLSATIGELVVALSTPFPEVTIGPDTPVLERTFKYRIYGR